MLEVGGVRRIRTRLEGLRSLGLPKRVRIRKPGLDPCIVVHHVGVGNHGFLGGGASASVDVLGWQDVLLRLWEGERDGWPLGRDRRVTFEALVLIRRGVRLH
jgi:hypothetical protein